MAEDFPQYPPRTALPNLSLDKSTVRQDVDVEGVARGWLSSLLQSLSHRDSEALSALFLKEAWWRDLVALSWTITSKNGPSAIADFLLGCEASLCQARVITTMPLLPQLVDLGPMTVVQFGFTFSTRAGNGRGIIRLGNDGPNSWRAWTCSTQLESLHSQAIDGTYDMGQDAADSDEYQVLIVGAGQSGVMLGAWCKELGLKYLIVDKESRQGDGWRQRYASIKSHTPIYADHFPFLKFPSNWPKFLTRNLMADWIEHYSGIMDLNVLPDATITSVSRNETAAKYTIHVSLSGGDGEHRVFKSRHIVLATGVFPPIPFVPDLPGRGSFDGECYHSLEHTSAANIADLQAKKVVVVGSGTSAHDIAQDFVSHGARDVTMIQRGRIFAVSSHSFESFHLSGWNTPGIDTDDADLPGQSMPLAVSLTLAAGTTPMMMANDEAMISGLERAGMALAKGEDGISLLDYQTVKIGHFYIDQGAAEMIIDGRIKIRCCRPGNSGSGGGVRAMNERGVVLADGTQVDADIVIMATGLKLMEATIEQIVGAEIADRADKPWLMTAEAERPGLARPTGVPGLWYMAGGFMLCRQLARLLALQIAAIERGFNPGHFGRWE